MPKRWTVQAPTAPIAPEELARELEEEAAESDKS
jgi:hypothetical protein